MGPLNQIIRWRTNEVVSIPHLFRRGHTHWVVPLWAWPVSSLPLHQALLCVFNQEVLLTWATNRVLNLQNKGCCHDLIMWLFKTKTAAHAHKLEVTNKSGIISPHWFCPNLSPAWLFPCCCCLAVLCGACCGGLTVRLCCTQAAGGPVRFLDGSCLSCLSVKSLVGLQWPYYMKKYPLNTEQRVLVIV